MWLNVLTDVVFSGITEAFQNIFTTFLYDDILTQVYILLNEILTDLILSKKPNNRVEGPKMIV